MCILESLPPAVHSIGCPVTGSNAPLLLFARLPFRSQTLAINLSSSTKRHITFTSVHYEQHLNKGLRRIAHARCSGSFWQLPLNSTSYILPPLAASTMLCTGFSLNSVHAPDARNFCSSLKSACVPIRCVLTSARCHNMEALKSVHGALSPLLLRRC
jgi:hypothetical protein